MIFLNKLKSLVSEIDPSIRGDFHELDEDFHKLISDTLVAVKNEEQEMKSRGALGEARVLFDHLGLPVPDSAYADYQRVKALADAALSGHPVQQAGNVPVASAPVAPAEPATASAEPPAPAAGPEAPDGMAGASTPLYDAAASDTHPAS